MQIFGQVWLWSLGSFLLGALFTWLLLVRPARRRLAELEDAGPRRFEQPQQTRIAEPFAPPGTSQTDKSLDDLFDTQQKFPPPLPPIVPPAPSLFTPAPVAPEAIQSRLEAGPVAPPEPPIQDESDTELSDNPFRQFAESTTVFVPPPNLQAPPEVEPTGEDWFSKEDESDPHLVTDVEDDEQVDDSGTIFTQHTTPIPAEMIRSLDESQPQAVVPSRHGLDEEEAVPEPYEEPAAAYEEPAYEPASAAYQQEEFRPSPAPRQPDVEPATEIYEPAQEVYEPAQAYSQVYQPDPPAGRSLFEPVVPVADAGDGEAEDFVPPGPFGPGSAMPLPGGGSPAPEFNVKASVTALRYCTQDNPQFDRIVAEVWFRTPSDAERVGFRVLS